MEANTLRMEVAQRDAALDVARQTFRTQRDELTRLRARIATLASPSEAPEIIEAILMEPLSGEYEAVAPSSIANEDDCPI
jgi:hypothetical protein